jgi:multidrug efflux pump subunit AcrB
MTHGQYILFFLLIVLVVSNVLIFIYKKELKTLIILIDVLTIYLGLILALMKYIEPIKIWLKS